MAIAARSLESEQPFSFGGVIRPILSEVTPHKVWGHIWWDTQLGTIVNRGAEKLADTGENVRRTLHNVHAIILRPPIPQEYADIARAFAMQSLGTRERRSTPSVTADGAYIAAYEPGTRSGARFDPRLRLPQVTEYTRPAAPPTVPLQYPRTQDMRAERSYSGPQTPFEEEFLRWSPRRRVEYMWGVVQQQKMEILRLQAEVEHQIETRIAQMKARIVAGEEQFRLASRDIDPLPRMRRVIRPLQV